MGRRTLFWEVSTFVYTKLEILDLRHGFFGGGLTLIFLAGDVFSNEEGGGGDSAN
jgi:hypothetical protein